MDALWKVGKSLFCFILLGFSHSSLVAQLTLETVLTQARENAPVYAIQRIIASENDLQIDNIGKSWRPQISLLGQATYQSEVTEIDIPIPGIEVASLAKDQYKIQAEINQTIYDGGLSQKQKTLQMTATAIEKQGIELELESVREQIIQSYFAVLEIDARLKMLALKKEDLRTRQKVVQAAVDNGTLLKMEAQSLEAALLQLDQETTNLSAGRKTQLQVLALLTHSDITEQSTLEIPATIELSITPSADKPMYRLLDLQQLSLDQQNELSGVALRPRAGLFVQGGYGRPGLNFLKNDFSPYYILGARIQWNLNGLYTQSNNAQLKVLGKEKIQSRKTQYDLGINTQQERYLKEIEKLELMMVQDEQILSLREAIQKTAEVQVDNGVMTTADYLLRLNEANAAREQKALHEIQKIKQQYLLQHLTGNYTIR